MNFIKETWRGGKPLIFTYWVIGVVGTLILNVIAAIMEPAIADPDAGIGIVLFSIVFFMFFFVYLIFSLVAIWRSAGKYIEDESSPQVIGKSTPFWGYVAKALVIIGVIQVVWVFVAEFM